MAIDFNNLQTVTAAQLLALVEHAISQILVGGQAYGADGRNLTRADLSDLFEQRDKLKAEVATAEATEGGGILLVQYGERM